MQQGERVAISAIAGMAGVGKTELVLQYAHAHWQQQTYPGGVCWLVARELDLGTQVVAFARTYLQLHPPEDLDLHSQVAFCWRHWLPGQVLVVLDDVTNYQEVKPHLPPCEPRFKVLMTTRLQLGAPLERLDLDVLTPEAALDLLKSLIGDVRVEAELEVAKALCEWLGYLPLGLELVGRYLAIEEDLSLAEIQEQLAQARLLDEALVEAQPEMTARLGVASAFELSWKRLDENVQALGYLLSLFALGPIPWSLVESAATLMAAKDLQKARRALVQLNLIKRTQKDTYQLHQLIREFLSAKREQSASADDLKRGFCQAMVAVAKKIPETPALEEIVALNSTIPHLAEVATAQQDWLRDEDLICPFVGLGYFYEGQGAYHQAASWLEQCLSITRNRLGEEHPDVATTLSNLAVPYYFQGRYDQAEPLYVQALALRKRLLGEEHPDVATSLNNLASLYHAQGRYNQAEFLSVQCLALRKQLLGEEHPDVAQSLNNLAMVYHSQGRYDQAEPLLVQALALRKQLLGGEHSGVATSLNNLALLYYFQGKYDQAEPLLVQALALRKRLLGEEHPDVAQSLNNLAKLYHAQGRYNQVEPLFVQALEIAERKLGANHPNTVIFRKNLQKLRDARSS